MWVHGAVFAPHAIFIFARKNTWLREFSYRLKPLDFFRHANVKILTGRKGNVQRHVQGMLLMRCYKVE